MTKWLREYKEIIIAITAVAGIFFGVFGIFLNFFEIKQTKENLYLQIRPYVNLKKIEIFSSSNIRVEIKNEGQSIAGDVMIGLFKINNDQQEERLKYKLSTGGTIWVKDGERVYEITAIGLLGDLNPNTTKTILVDFISENEFGHILTNEDTLVIKIIYDDYLNKGNEHHYQLKYDKDKENFYFVDEFEERAGNTRTLFIHKVL